MHNRAFKKLHHHEKEIKSVTFELEVKPDTLDHSKRVDAKQSRSWLSELDTSSNVHN